MIVREYSGELPNRGRRNDELATQIKNYLVESAKTGKIFEFAELSPTDMGRVPFRIRSIADRMGYKVSIRRYKDTMTVLFHVVSPDSSPPKDEANQPDSQPQLSVVGSTKGTRTRNVKSKAATATTTTKAAE